MQRAQGEGCRIHCCWHAQRLPPRAPPVHQCVTSLPSCCLANVPLLACLPACPCLPRAVAASQGATCCCWRAAGCCWLCSARLSTRLAHGGSWGSTRTWMRRCSRTMWQMQVRVHASWQQQGRHKQACLSHGHACLPARLPIHPALQAGYCNSMAHGAFAVSARPATLTVVSYVLSRSPKCHWICASHPSCLRIHLPHWFARYAPISAAVEALLHLFITAPPLPLSLKLFNYMPTDTRSVLRIVRTAAGATHKRGGCTSAAGLPALGWQVASRW